MVGAPRTGEAGKARGAGEAAESAGPGGKPKAVAKALSSKTMVTQESRKSRNVLGFANVMPTLYKMLQFQTYKALYTIEEIEAKLYDIQHHDSDTRLLQQTGIISLDDDAVDIEELADRSHVIRCFTDRRAKYAAILLLSSVLVTFIVTPMSFIYGGSWSTSHGYDSGTSFVAMRVLMAVDISADVVYAGYLLMQLNMSFMHLRRRVEVISHEKILRRWLLDPLYYIQWLSATTYIWIIACDAPLLINNIKFVRVVHWLLFPDPLWLAAESRGVRVGRLLFLLLACSHWVACVLFWGGGYREQLSMLGASAPPLRFNGEDLPNTGHLRLYMMALVESVYMMTGALDNPLGDGGPRENNLASLVIVSVFGPIGMVVVAILIAAVVREQALQFALEIRHEENMAFVTRALENLNIPAELQRRVVSLHYFQKMSHDTEAFSQLFNKNNLSGPLEDAIRVYLYHKVLSSAFFTRGGPNYLLAVVRVLEDSMYLPGDYVARRGEVGAEMFFINRGELSVLVPGADSDDIADAVLIVGRKRKGAYFGEVALVKKSLRTAWVRAETYVIVSVLHRHSIEEIWEFFPLEREALVAHVSQTMERDKQRVMRTRWQDAVKDVASGAKQERQDPEGAPAAGALSDGARTSVLERTARTSIPSAKAARASRCLQGRYPAPPPVVTSISAAATAAMAMRAESSHADDLLDEVTTSLQALREQGELHHRLAMQAAEQQRQRLDALERQVARLAALSEEAMAKAHGCSHSNKPGKKRHHAHRMSQVTEVRVESKPECAPEWPPGVDLAEVGLSVARGAVPEARPLSSLEQALWSLEEQEAPPEARAAAAGTKE